MDVRVIQVRSRRSAAASAPADHAAVRRNNLSYVLAQLQEAPASRAALATATGLNKATVSSLVAELVDRGLVREVGLDYVGSAGRPALIVELDGSGVAGLGLEVNVDHISAYGVDLAGRVLHESRIPYDALAGSTADAMSALAAVAHAAITDVHAAGAELAGITVAIPGLVDVDRGIVTWAPNLRWRNLPVADLLRSALRTDVPVRVDNDANLSALAEYSSGAEAGTRDLLYLTGEVGVGGGMIIDGQLLRGSTGFSGEVGHMQLDPNGRACACGRFGCWETLVGLGALLSAAAPDLGDALRSGVMDPEDRVAEIVRRVDAGEARTVTALADVGRWLGVGAAVLVNLFNPRVIVLGGYFARVGPYILDSAMDAMRGGVIAPNAGGCRLSFSTLGFGAATRGGAGMALLGVVADPTLVPLNHLTQGVRQ
ncbi:MAG: ROK family transcriptional regulator [Mycobacteriales bacterium]